MFRFKKFAAIYCGLALVNIWQAQGSWVSMPDAAKTIPTAVANTQSYHSPLRIGVRCQNDYQNGWAPSIDMYSMCGDYFIPTISQTDNVDFYFNLEGAQPAFQTGSGAEVCSGCGGVNSVDFLFMGTHGGNWSNTDAVYAMWDYWTVASSANMRLGDVGQQLKILATYACDTFNTSEGHFIDRWYPAYAGGLKEGLGGHDFLYDGNSQKGWEFAARMQNGEPISNAWNEAVWYADNDNHPSAAVTGADSGDCWNRMGMNLGTMQELPALRDGQIGYFCWAGWNGN